MSVMDSLINAMKIGSVDEDDYDDYDDDGYDEPSAGGSVLKLNPFKKSERQDMNEYEDVRPTRQERKVAEKPSYSSYRNTQRRSSESGAGMEVCVIKPTSVEEARELTDTLLANRTVVLNLEGLDVDIAQRIIDFTSGSCYAIHGNLMKISHYIFVVTPESVDISGDISATMGGLGAASEKSSGFDMPYTQN